MVIFICINWVCAFLFFLFGPNDVLGNNFGTITLTPIILILIYFTLIMLLINYLEFRAYQDFKRVLKLQTAKKTRHKTTPTKNINKHTETDDNDELSVDERFSWVLFIGLLTFLIIVFLMTDVIPIELLQSIGMIILILIPIIILFYYLRYHRCFSNLWTTGSPQIEKQSKRSKIVIETVETQPEDLIDIDDLKCKPPSPLLVKTLFFGLILFGFGIIIFYSIHEVLSNIVTQIYLLMIWILIFYGFYNLGIPRGGADTKALMALVIVFPFYPIIQYLTVQTSFYQMLELVPIIGYMFPFAFSVLINGAVIMLVYIILLVFYNASHHDLKLPHAFLGYKLPINEIPNKFVWLMERIENGKRKLQPFPKNSLDLRHELNLLKKHGLKKVWVTPKVPFIIPLTLGLILVVVVGNILFLIIGLFV